MNINLHIERLVVDETVLGRLRRAGLQAAVEAELARLLAAGNLPAQWLNRGAVPSLQGGNIQVRQAGDAAHLGTQIAQTVYGAMQGPSRDGSR